MTQSNLGAAKKISRKISRERAHARLTAAKLSGDAWEIFEASLVLGRVRVRYFKWQVSDRWVRKRLCLVPACGRIVARESVHEWWARIRANGLRFCEHHLPRAWGLRLPEHLR